MLKNNIYSIIIHTVICFGTSMLSMMIYFNGPFDNLIYIIGICGLFTIMMYILAGLIIMEKYRSSVYNILSVSIVSIFLILGWFLKEVFNVFPTDPSILSYFFMYVLIKKINNYWTLIFALAPSILMWLGVQLKRDKRSIFQIVFDLSR